MHLNETQVVNVECLTPLRQIWPAYCGTTVIIEFIVQRFDAEGDLYDMAVLTMALIRDSFLAEGITHLHAACARPTWRVPLDALNSCSDLWLDTLHGQYSLSWNMLDHGNGRQLTLGGVYLGTMQRRNRTLNFRQCQRKHGRWRRFRRISTLISRILSCSSSLGP